MVEVREEPRKISSQGKVGAAEAFMRVTPSPLPFIAERALLQKLIPSFVPCIERLGEFLSGGAGQRECDDAQFLSCIQLRSTRQLLRDCLDLMELTLLDGNMRMPLLEQRSDTFPSVDGEGLEPQSCRLQYIETLRVLLHLLALNFFPVQIPPIGAAHQQSIRPLEECGVHEEIHWLWFYNDFSGRPCMSIEIFTERLRVFAIRLSKISVGLPSSCVGIVGLLYPLLLDLVAANKLSAAAHAPKLLTT